VGTGDPLENVSTASWEHDGAIEQAHLASRASKPRHPAGVAANLENSTIIPHTGRLPASEGSTSMKFFNFLMQVDWIHLFQNPNFDETKMPRIHSPG
jgi:hypothetical protein